MTAILSQNPMPGNGSRAVIAEEILSYKYNYIASLGRRVWAGNWEDTRLENPLRERFKELVHIWKEQRDPSQLTMFQVRHHAYRQIIEMGFPAVQYLLEELRDDPDEWFIALAEITGADPYKPEEKGKFQAKVNAWLNWGRANGFIS